MPDTPNPYESPQSDLNARAPVSSAGTLTEPMLRYLKEASPWIRFCGILGYICCGLALIGGAIAFIVGLVTTAQAENFGGMPLAALSLIYLIIGIVMLIPVRFLHKFGTKIRNYVQTSVESELEAAFKNNKSYWKFTGILIIIYLAAAPVLAITAAIIGISASLLP
jgi:hypothetical protein